MAKQTVNLGTNPNDGTGDNLRAGGQKINDNFTELYGLLWNESVINLTAINWSANEQTVTINGLLETSDVMVFPPVNRTAFLAYGDAQISAIVIATDTITFACTTTPTIDINNVIILWR